MHLHQHGTEPISAPIRASPALVEFGGGRGAGSRGGVDASRLAKETEEASGGRGALDRSVPPTAAGELRPR